MIGSKQWRARRRLLFGLQAARCRNSPCVVCVRLGIRQVSRSEAHHEPVRARGGVDRDTVPLCREHHAYRHDVSGTHLVLGVDLLVEVERFRSGAPLGWEALPA